MSSERVSVLDGKNSNIMVVAPHGPDDKYTIEMAHALHETIDCHAVINNSFERADLVDSINDLANCNDTNHCIDDPVIYEEFTKPIVNFVNGWEQSQIRQSFGLLNPNGTAKEKKKCFIFWLHGMNYQNPYDCVFGYGLGIKSDRFTMQPWRATCLYETLELSFSYKCAMGKAGGKYAARSRDNMTQLFCIDEWETDIVEAVQIEYSSKMRKDAATAVSAAVNLGQILNLVTTTKLYIPQSSSLNYI